MCVTFHFQIHMDIIAHLSKISIFLYNFEGVYSVSIKNSIYSKNVHSQAPILVCSQTSIDLNLHYIRDAILCYFPSCSLIRKEIKTCLRV